MTPVDLFALAVTGGTIALFACALSIALPNPFRVFRNYGSPADHGLTPERHEIDGRIPAWLFDGPSESIVVVCHGRSRGKAFELPLLARLVRDFRVLAFDFPGHGETRYSWATIGWREADTVSAVLRWLEARGESSVLVYGVSQGGAAVVRALARETPENVRAIATDGVFANLTELLLANGKRFLLPRPFTELAIGLAGRLAGYDPRRVRPERDAAGIPLPWLVLHGEEDPLAPPSSARRLAGAARHARLALYPGTHDEPGNPAMQEALVAFFVEHGRSRGAA